MLPLRLKGRFLQEQRATYALPVVGEHREDVLVDGESHVGSVLDVLHGGDEHSPYPVHVAQFVAYVPESELQALELPCSLKDVLLVSVAHNLRGVDGDLLLDCPFMRGAARHVSLQGLEDEKQDIMLACSEVLVPV